MIKRLLDLLRSFGEKAKFAIADRGNQWTLEYAPCKGGGHTTFVLLRKPRSKRVEILGSENFALCTELQRQTTREEMARLGYLLVETA